MKSSVLLRRGMGGEGAVWACYLSSSGEGVAEPSHGEVEKLHGRERWEER